jgi:hypothetical protein
MYYRYEKETGNVVYSGKEKLDFGGIWGSDLYDYIESEIEADADKVTVKNLQLKEN